MQAQDKSMKETWSYSCLGVGHIKFTSAKKISDYSEELNAIITSALSKALKIKKESNSKSEDKENSKLDDELEHFNFKICKLEQIPTHDDNLSARSV